MLSRLFATLRYFKHVREFLGRTTTLEEAREIVTNQLASREASFLEILERAVYTNPSSPYHRLLQHAGITFAEVKRLVAEIGLEATLGRLHDAGVYVTQDEFKGRRPIERNGLEIKVRPVDFDNPIPQTDLPKGETSGSTGPALQVSHSVERYEYNAAEALFLDELLLGTRPLGAWQSNGIHAVMMYSRSGRTPEKIFTTVGFRRSWEGIRSTVLVWLTLMAARLAGKAVPRPQYVPNDSAVTIARWLAHKAAAGTPAIFRAHPSQVLTICLAARDHGVDLDGTIFQMGGEPYTPTRAAVLSSVGASALVRYVSRETSLVGIGCSTPRDVDDTHLLSPKTVLVCRGHELQNGENVTALIFTNLLTSSPKITINLYSGDYADVTERECGCPLGEMGFTTHMSNIRSYEKLTSGGVTFIGSKLFDLVEDVLPARFGGHLNDYQLVEEEGPDGVPRVLVVVSPDVGALNENALIESVLKGLQQRHARNGGGLMTTQWRHWETLKVVRRKPYQTRNGKVLPLHFLKPASTDRAEAELEAATT